MVIISKDDITATKITTTDLAQSKSENWIVVLDRFLQNKNIQDGLMKIVGRLTNKPATTTQTSDEVQKQAVLLFIENLVKMGNGDITIKELNERLHNETK